MKKNVKTLVTLAMLAALSYVLLLAFKLIPGLNLVGLSFLRYDPKDVIIVISGFIYGPLASVAISVVVSLVEMLTVSDTGWIGLLMNVLSTCAFAVPAALVYKKWHKLPGAIVGLVSGVLCMTLVMILWNYLLTPIYMTMPREAIVPMLPTVFLPFNLIKGGINAAVAMLLYKPLISALRAAHLVEPSKGEKAGGGVLTLVIVLISLLVASALVLTLLAINGII